MADKNNTSSLLEAIKNKLSKFDNKPKPESKKSPVNYFSQDLPDAEIDKTSIDKTNIGLIFEAEKKLENIRRKNLNQNTNKQKDIDLDLDDESLNVKDLGQKISIESKIKEIADELNLEEFEDDFEDDGMQKFKEEIVDEVNKDIDPIDIELMELEKEITKNNQQKTQNNSEDQIAEDLNLKTYLDSKFEDEFEKIEKEIKKEQNIQEVDLSNVLKPIQNNENDNNSNKINFNEAQNQILFKITPAQDFLNKKAEESIEEKVEEALPIETSFEEKVEENIVENKNIAEEIVEEKIEEKVEEKVEEDLPIQASFEEKVEENIVENKNIAEEIVEEKIEEALPIQASFEEKVEEKIVENYSPKEQFQKFGNQNVENTKQQSDFININEQEPLKSNAEINEKNNLILEKINYNLIHEETIYQASNSMKKLMEAKNLVNNIGNFARDETLTKIAINLMEPKLEKWLNENLPLMVENIVREEIEKIVPKV
jgi:cell pole-organizing protein PopZ